MNENENEVKPSPLRASNTVSTLKPVEVNASFPIPESGIAGELRNPRHLQKALDDLADWAKDIPLSGQDVETVPSPEQQQTLFGLPEGDFESGFADDHCFAYTPDEAHFNNSLLQRVERLEEQVDGLLDRIAKYNIRAQHRI